MNATLFEVDGLNCDACTSKLEQAVGGMDGVCVVHANYVHGLTTVLYDPEAVDKTGIARAIESCGFAVRAFEWHAPLASRRGAFRDLPAE
jgi:copper chaperone CopZ